MRGVILLTIVLIWAKSGFASDPGWKQKAQNPDFIHRSIKVITDVMVHDIYAPPVASRTYAYVTLAGYEAAITSNPQYRSLSGQLNGFTLTPLNGANQEFCPALSAVHAMLSLGKSFLISEQKVVAFHQGILQEFKKIGVPEPVYKNSLNIGEQVAAQVLAWSKKDNYRETRSFPKYSVEEEENTWKPTPPAYMRAVEPHWGKIRTFFIDSAQQFKPPPPPRFSSEKESLFYKEAFAVYDAAKMLTPEQKAIANFWDCNPFKMNVRGHVVFATKKISPGGHWVNITALACKKAQLGVLPALEAYVSVCIAMADGFISCWDEKYRSNTVRPETYINQYIDQSWVPLLQTPPFPEYTSGHSVISNAAATILSRLLGESFSFTDVTEAEFGLPARKFGSFAAAAQEAAISRFYGGIHYMPAIENGLKEGKELGDYLLRKLQTRAAPVAVH